MREPVSPILRRVYVAQTVGATIDGIALSTAVLYFHGLVGLPSQTVGFVIAAAAICALVLITRRDLVAAPAAEGPPAEAVAEPSPERTPAA